MDFIKKLLFGEDHPIIRNIISATLMFCTLMGIDLGFRYIYRWYDPAIVDVWIPLVFSICWCVLLCSISFLLPRIARRIYNIGITVIYSVLILVHAFFMSFFGSYMSVSSFMFAGEGADFFEWSYFDIPKKLIAMLVLAIFVSVISALIIPKTNYSVIKVMIPVLIFAATVAGINVLSVKAFSDEGAIWVYSTAGIADIYDMFTDTKACMHMTGIYQYTFRDISVTTGFDSVFDSYKYAELDKYYSEKKIDPDNDMTGIFKDKNLILIQLESIDTWAVNDIAMPNLKKLQAESINFTNYYTPNFLLGATFNTENIVNTGLIAPSNSSKISLFTSNYYPYSMANLFANEGYSAYSFHRGWADTYNRGDVHVNWGYEKYVGRDDLEVSNPDFDSCLMEAYDKFTAGDRFMSFIITFSGHGPFEQYDGWTTTYYNEIASQLPEGTDQEYIYSLCHAHDTDLFIGELFEQLESDGHIDDTVVNLYEDHYNHYLSNTELLYELKGTSDKNMLTRVPFMIYSKDIGAMTVDKVVSSYDILPTIVNLFDLNTDGRYYVGNDAFSENGGYAMFSDKSWYDGETYFKFYESDTTELSKARGEEITDRLNASFDTVKTDYFKHLFK